MNIGIAGLGFVGSAMMKSFSEKGVSLSLYDKYKNIGDITNLTDCDIIFLCLPTKYIDGAGYDKSAIYEVCDQLEDLGYKNTVVLKSTVEPGTTSNISTKYSFDMMHNPEFLSAATAYEDFHNQSHIVIGVDDIAVNPFKLINFYEKYYPDAEVSLCLSDESEAMKLFCNNFYAMKIMIFNEFYDLCKNKNIDYNMVVSLMLKNNWINPMHTKVPGTDGKLAYGGYCFPKDTNALKEFTDRAGSLNRVLKAVIFERDMLRDDHDNVIKEENNEN